MRQATAAGKAGRVADAEMALRHVLARDSANNVARVRLAQVALERGDLATAVTAVQPVPDADPLALAARLIESDAWFQMNRLIPTEACWLRARQLDPEHPAVCHGLIHLYGTQLRRSLWRNILWEVYDRDQAGLEEMLQLMLAGLELTNFSANISRLRLAVAADPDDRHTRRALALHLLRTGELQEARRDLVGLYDEHPEDGETWLALADCLVADADSNALEELLAHPPTELSDRGRYWQILGSAALLQSRPRDAIENYRRALQASPFLAYVHVKITEALRTIGDHESSRPHLEMTKETARIEQFIPMLHTNGWDLDLICQLVSSCEKLWLVEEARGWVRVGLSNAPDNTFLQEARIRLKERPSTSSRNPPTWESLEQSLCW
jgi:predicted Zn-dependent protease